MPDECLFPADPNAKKLLQYFDHHWDFIIAPANSKDWQTIKHYKLQPRVLWHKFQDPSQVLGVRFGKSTKYAMVDLDRGSLLHFARNPQAFQDLCAAFELIGLCRYVILFSSFTRGVHIYLPINESVNTFDLACALRMAVENSGFKIKGGQLEIFPNTKTYKKNSTGKQFSHFNGHRLPLQPNTGSVLLDDDLNPYSDDLSDFFRQMEWAAEGQDLEKLQDTLSIARDWYYQRQYRFNFVSSNSKVKQWQEDTEALIDEGFTDFGQTNVLIREAGKYGRVFQALEGVELHQFIVKTIIHLPGYKQYCRHQHEIEKRCHHWAKIIERFWWALGTTPTRHISYEKMAQEGQQKPKNSLLNQERARDSQDRLKQTLAHLIERAIALPQKVGDRLKLLCETSKQLFGKGFSEGTLKKANYRPLWHPKFDSERSPVKSDSESEPISQSETNSNIPNCQSPKVENILHEDILVKDLSVITSSDEILPTNVARKNSSNKKSLKSISNKDFSKKDPTLSYMKGSNLEFDFLAFQEMLVDENICNHEGERLVKEKQEQNIEQKNNTNNTTKTYCLNSAEKLPQKDKKNLSNSLYYQELLARHPEWKALDRERENPEYQKNMKQMLAEVKQILRRKSRPKKFGFDIVDLD